MSAPQIIRAPSGEELVVLPRAEYEALLERANHEAEDNDDVAIYDAREGRISCWRCSAAPGGERGDSSRR